MQIIQCLRLFANLWIIVQIISLVKCGPTKIDKQLNYNQNDPLLYAQNMDSFYENNYLNLTDKPAIPNGQCGTRFGRFQPRRASKIIGGMPVIYGEFPWQVQIQHFNFEKSTFVHHCGGAVVGERLILSAAHCLQVTNTKYLRVVIGEHNLNERDLHEHSFQVDDILIHPEYRKSGLYSNDIGIIKVKANSDFGIGFNTHVQPICIPSIGETPLAGAHCTVTGWGLQRAENVKSIADELRAALVPILDTETCRMVSINGGKQQKILDTMLCAGPHRDKNNPFSSVVGSEGVDSCRGDSGGPLSCESNGRFVLTGLVSWGDGCAKRNRPGVYTRVESFRDWIIKSMARLEID